MRAAIGLFSHTGWSAALAVVGGPARVIERSRLDLVEQRFEVGAVYHVAKELPISQAEARVLEIRERAERTAAAAIGAMVARLRDLGHEAIGCAIVGSMHRIPEDLAEVLRSHALIHAAEGRLYCGALATAAREHRLPVTMTAARALDPGAPALAKMRPAGPPWGRDQKLAALAALRLL